MKKLICIKYYSHDYVVGDGYDVKTLDARFVKINNHFFCTMEEDINFGPILSDYFITISEYRKMKLKNIETNQSRQNGEKMARNN